MAALHHIYTLVFLMMAVVGFVYCGITNRTRVGFEGLFIGRPVLRLYNGTRTFEVEAGNWDEFVLSLRWPFTACKMMGCRTREETWTIHGLWPGYSGRSDCPSGCPNDRYDKNVKNIRHIRKYWPDLTSRDPTSFWANQWYKHGQCSLQSKKVKTCYDYFQRAVKLRAKYDPRKAMEKEGIKPSNSKRYMTKTISKILKRAFKNKTVLLRCYERGNKYYLGEIRICFNKSLHQKSCRRARQCGDFDRTFDVTDLGAGPYYVDCLQANVLYYPRSV